MTRFTVPLSDILGSAYYRYELTSSDYNPTIDSTITITCTCKNVLGNPIANKTLELMMNGVSQGTSTTNANGIATWSITLNAWGNKHFHIGNATLDLVVTGFKVVTHTNQTYYVGEDIVHLFMHGSGSLTATTSWKDFGTVVGQSARPSANIPFMEQYGAVILRVKNDGTLQYRSITGSNVSMTSIVAYANWKK